MQRSVLIGEEAGETRVAILEDGLLVEYYEEGANGSRVAGNVYKGRVENVLPGMQAAFVNIGLERNAYLYVNDAYPLSTFGVDGEPPPEQKSRSRRASINELVRPGQEIIVQVSKEPVGTKGARVTCNFTLPGRFLVLLPGLNYVAVSHRVTSESERDRLRTLARNVRPRGMGLILRTAAEGRTEKDLAEDSSSLRRLWARIRKKARDSRAPALLHRDLSLVHRILRDALSPEVTDIVVDSPEQKARVLDLVRLFAPELIDCVRLHDHRERSLFESHQVDEELEHALGRRIWLRNGAYIVIDHTEAMTSIDVNTGRFVGTTNLEETVLATNLEAAREIARQLRLRDVGGIIVIDFIDMTSPQNRQQVIRKLEDELRRDRTKTTVLGITILGLVEMTRNKRRQSLSDLLTRTCHPCGGTGRVLTEMTTSRRARREIRRLLRETDSEAVLVEAHPSVAALLIGPGGANLRDLERETGKALFIRGCEESDPADIGIAAMGTREEVRDRALPVHAGQVLEVKVEEPHVTHEGAGIARVAGYVIDIEGAAGRVGERLKVEVVKAFRTYAKARLV